MDALQAPTAEATARGAATLTQRLIADSEQRRNCLATNNASAPLAGFTDARRAMLLGPMPQCSQLSID